jgi:photosynthetic reaction center H subunit
METGAITGYIDVAQVVLYIFWAFFFGLVIYLLRENKREGYPLDADGGRSDIGNFLLPIPAPKTFLRPDGGTYTAPNGIFDKRPIKGAALERFPGAPLSPEGDPMLAEIGPGSYAEREDVPDITFDGRPRLVPLRVDDHYEVSPGQTDPRGLPVIGCDGARGGTLRELWIDRAEAIARYYEVEVAGGESVLLPVPLARLNRREGYIGVKSITGAQFAGVPRLKNSDLVTHLEEEKICAYYGAGTLYATAARVEPLI